MGTGILVEGCHASEGTNKANGSLIAYADSKTLLVGSPSTGAPEPFR